MRDGRRWRIAAKAFCLVVLAGTELALQQSAEAAGDVSAACGRNFKPNVIRIDGDVNTPVNLTVDAIAALPGQQTLNITYINHLGVAQFHSETGPTLWTVLNIAAGGIKVPPPTPNQYPEQPAKQITLYVLVVGTDGYQAIVSEAEIDQNFGNAPILLAYVEDGVVLSDGRPAPPTSRDPRNWSCRPTPLAAVTPTRYVV